jgi:hypothetical protein
VPCPCSELGCTARPARCKLAEHTATCWYNQGRPQLEAWTDKFQSISDQLSQVKAELLEKQSAADAKLVKTDAKMAKAEISLSVLQQHNARLGLLARELVNERSGNDATNYFAGALRQLPEPDIARCKDFVQRTAGMTWTQNADGTVKVSAGSHCTVVQDLTLDAISVPSTRLCELVKLLPLCPTLTDLRIRFAATNDNSTWLDLNLVLAQCVLFKKLDLAHSKFTGPADEDKLTHFAPAIRQCRALTDLDVTFCDFNANSFSSLAKGLKQCTGLRRLRLSYSRFDVNRARELTPALPVSLTELFMVSCQTDGMSREDQATWCEVMCTALPELSQLQKLDFDGALRFGDLRPNDEEADATLAKVDPQSHAGHSARWYCGRCWNLGGTWTGPQCASCSRLQTTAGMAGNIESILSGQAKLTALLHNCKALIELHLACCNLSPASAKVLAQALPHSPKLQFLLIYENAFGTAGCVDIANVLSQCPSLTHLDLAENDMGDEGALALATALPGCAKLTHLDAGRAEIDAQGMLALANALAPSKLTNLCLRRNHMARQDAIQFGQALLTQLRQLPAARRLHIDVFQIGLTSDDDDDDDAEVLQELVNLCNARPHLSFLGEADDY